MDTSYSENWEFLLKLLNNDSEKALHDNGNFFEHQKAYALALFLANALAGVESSSEFFQFIDY
ncbi:hypothetical protein [Providencia rustigianii]|uniref:hypothetical protein n=1 Tax=Providencia rustigianii TaxID=158850 RepID=UPI002240DE39|nr:hypothetical protein [Providencia rustigianii]